MAIARVRSGQNRTACVLSPDDLGSFEDIRLWQTTSHPTPQEPHNPLKQPLAAIAERAFKTCAVL